jgi:threonine dehydrogenase-like Zn-dependent dehydrogenase
MLQMAVEAAAALQITTLMVCCFANSLIKTAADMEYTAKALQLIDQTLKLVRPGGKVPQFGHDELARPAIQVAEIVRKEITIYGASVNPASFPTTFFQRRRVTSLYLPE